MIDAKPSTGDRPPRWRRHLGLAVLLGALAFMAVWPGLADLRRTARRSLDTGATVMVLWSGCLVGSCQVPPELGAPPHPGHPHPPPRR